MQSRVRITGTIAAVMILAACTTSGANMKPTAQTSAAAPPAGCLRSTGSHFPPSDSYCAGPGSSYSSEDIERTGKTTVAGALPVLDPAIIVRH
jgi:hypothetical protein